MKLAILFWFYKEPEICKNRLKLLKKYNSDLKIFGLFGGEQQEAGLFKEKLSIYLDDFYSSSYKSKAYKWYYGDLILQDWYNQRGKYLAWDSIIEIQWDTLVFDSLQNVFNGIKKNDIFLSGLRILNNYVENRWDWTDLKFKWSIIYQKFRRYIKKNYHYTQKTLCWLAIIAVLPRLFFDKYQTVRNKKIGFMEYKMPTYAKILKIPFYKKELGVWWFLKGKYPLNAVPKEIDKKYINDQLNKSNGWRIFHPYFKIWQF